MDRREPVRSVRIGDGLWAAMMTDIATHNSNPTATPKTQSDWIRGAMKEFLRKRKASREAYKRKKARAAK